MSLFHTLTVTDIHRTIREAVVVTLEPDDPSVFAYTQGQYLTFRRKFGDQEVRRNYSICAGLDDAALQIGIKRVEGGAFSSWANDDLRIGDTLQAMAPRGRFHTPIDAKNPRNYLGFAGGSGITPVLSTLKTVLSREPGSTFTLVYANRAVSTIMFREELEDLKNRYMGRLTIIHVLESDAQEIDLFMGRVDGDKCALLFRHWIDIASVDTALICGPEPMMLAIRSALQRHGLADNQIMVELFSAAQVGRAEARAISKRKDRSSGSTNATIILDGAAQSFDMERDVSVLEAALANNLDAPFACRAGVCASCRARLVEGEVDMIANHALEDYEVEQGYILTCQSYPVSGRIVVDYDV